MHPVVGKCSRCGTTLAADAPLGLCAKCLLAAAVPNADSLGLDTLGVSSALEGALAEETGAAQTATAGEVVGNHIGPYKLLQKIGEGGMGVVYMAEQERPVVRRVAIKIIKLGMDTKQVIARFEAERQALALMDHPNIAKVLDAGATETGRPYFVMELVRGVSITEYCDSNNLSTRQRLELFLPVCRAVQHAHQKGIIHRDLKPSNVLISMHDGVPVPKVIDFGIAKATSGRLTDKTLFTEYHQFVGTPEYMSPEQAEMSGLDIDTRADVYALGVLLYELLTGTTPFDGKQLRSAAYTEIQRIIREVEPPKPSTRVSTLGETLTKVAAHRGIEPRKLGAVMRGDLDWIVMKCLEKDRTRRYETASELGVEIERHLKNETVLAGPTSAAYRVRKFVRRHRIGVAASTAVVLSLVLGIIGTTYGLMRAKNETANAKKETLRATQEADKATAVTDFLQQMLASANPVQTSRSDITVRQIVDEAARKIDGGSLKEQPAVEEKVRYTLGVTFMGLGQREQAEAQLRKSLALAETIYGTESPEVANALLQLGNLRWLFLSDGIDLLQRALKISQKCFGKNSLNVALILNQLAKQTPDRDAAEAYAREAIRIFREKHDEKHTAMVLTILGKILSDKRQYAESLLVQRESLGIYRKYGEDSDWVAWSYYGVALALRRMGDFQGCDEQLTRCVEIQRKIFTVKHRTVRYNLLQLADVRLRRRDYARAADLLLELQNSLTQPEDDDPYGVWPMWVAAKLVQLYNSSGNQKETEHWRQIWANLKQEQIAKLTAKITAKKDDAELYRERALGYSSLGEFDKAAADCAAAISLDPQGAIKDRDFNNLPLPFEWLRRACLLAYLNDIPAYKEHCRSMLERFGDYRTGKVQESRQVRMFTAKCCLLLPEAPLELKRITDVVDGAEGPPAEFLLEWFFTAKGLAEYRLGHYQQAIEWSTKGRDGAFELEEKIENELIVAMASFKWGRRDQARSELARATDQIDKDLPHLGIGDINDIDQFMGFAIEGWLTCQILFREANELILAGKSTTQQGVVSAVSRPTSQPSSR